MPGAAQGTGRNPTECWKVRGKGICAPTFLALNLLRSVPPACWERERECHPCFTPILVLVVLHAPGRAQQHWEGSCPALGAPSGVVPLLSHAILPLPLCLPLSPQSALWTQAAPLFPGNPPATQHSFLHLHKQQMTRSRNINNNCLFCSSILQMHQPRTC